MSFFADRKPIAWRPKVNMLFILLADAQSYAEKRAAAKAAKEAAKAAYEQLGWTELREQLYKEAGIA